MEYRAYGYIRILLYALGAVAGATGGSFLLFIVARVIPFLRVLGVNIFLDIFLVTFLSIAAGYWLTNHFFIVPFTTRLHDLGFVADAPNRPEHEVSVLWPEVQSVVGIGFGTYVTARTRNGRYYRFIFGKDTDGYYRMVGKIQRQFEKNQLRHRHH